MASPDTIIVLIVDYHAATGGKTLVLPLRTALIRKNLVKYRRVKYHWYGAQAV